MFILCVSVVKIYEQKCLHRKDAEAQNFGYADVRKAYKLHRFLETFGCEYLFLNIFIFASLRLGGEVSLLSPRLCGKNQKCQQS